jgi:hypothetical protein
MLRNTWIWFSGGLSYAPLFPGPRRPVNIIFADDYNVAETMTRHRPRLHESGPFAVARARGVTVLRVRRAFTAVHWLVRGEPNEVKYFKTNLFHTK